jgi:23S rRNA G2445 N2-methylase RlmL
LSDRPDRRKSKPQPDLRRAVQDPGFTPGARHVPALAALTADSELGEDVERALARLGTALAPALGAVLEAAPPRARVHLLRALGRTGDASAPAIALLEGALRDPDERTRRAAEVALGKLGIDAPPDTRTTIETSLLDAWPRATTETERRALADALGKVGGERARALLEPLAPTDPELARIVTRARLVVARGERRQQPARILGNITPTAPLTLVFTCRRGLERFVVEELEATGLEATIAGAGRVRAVLADRPLDVAFRSRVAERFAIALPATPGRGPATPGRGPADAKGRGAPDLVESVTRALLDAESLLGALTEGAIRFRLSWRGGGHRRAVVWKIAERVASSSSRLVNDPTNTLWEVEIDDRDRKSGVHLTVTPRGLPDPRFAYRSRDVPAASHPTIAAALARVAGVSATDIVWDPFVGSGLELIERANLGAYRKLYGTDIDPRALEAASTNLAAAGLEATLTRADAAEYFPEGTNVVITNPPMGRRVHRAGDLAIFLTRFVEHVLRKLPKGGRLVWLAPSVAQDAANAARRASIERIGAVDMAGFDAELQRITKK